jgi:hypothetical protein
MRQASMSACTRFARAWGAMAHPINLVSGQTLSNPFTNWAERQDLFRKMDLWKPEALKRTQEPVKRALMSRQKGS